MLKTHEVPTKAIAELTIEMGKPRFAASHPRRAQVPPNGLESTIATCHPASRQRDVTAEAADPVPIAITSNCLVMVPSRHFAFVPAS